MAHRNRWFTVLKNGGSFHGELLNNQMVFTGTLIEYTKKKGKTHASPLW
jgi:hypothetical protein